MIFFYVFIKDNSKIHIREEKSNSIKNLRNNARKSEIKVARIPESPEPIDNADKKIQNYVCKFQFSFFQRIIYKLKYLDK